MMYFIAEPFLHLLRCRSSFAGRLHLHDVRHKIATRELYLFCLVQLNLLHEVLVDVQAAAVEAAAVVVADVEAAAAVVEAAAPDVAAAKAFAAVAVVQLDLHLGAGHHAPLVVALQVSGFR